MCAIGCLSARVAHHSCPTGEVHAVIDPSGRSTTTVYEHDELRSVTNSRGDTTIYEYDDQGRVTLETRPDGGLVRFFFDYDETYLDDSQIDAFENAVWELGDDYHRTEIVVQPGANETDVATLSIYDTAGRLVRVIEADADGSTSSHSARVKKYTYNTAGQLATETYLPAVAEEFAANEQVITYLYDNLGRLIETRLPDPDGELGERTASVSRTIYLDQAPNTLPSIEDFDALSAVSTQQRAQYAAFVSAFGSLGRVVVQIAPGPAGLAELATLTLYDHLGRTVATIGPDPDGDASQNAPFTKSKYDAAGNVIEQTDALNRTTTFVYDGLNRITKVTSPDPDGSGSQQPIEVSTKYIYDANLLTAGQIAFYQQVQANGAFLGDIVLETSPGAETGQTVTTLTMRDKLGHVRYEIGPDPDPTDNASEAVISIYDYDAVGNLKQIIDPVGNVTTFTYNFRGQVTREKNTLGDEQTFDYDQAGNLTSVIDQAGRESVYTYDFLNRRMSEEWFENGILVEYVETHYDLADRLISLSDNSSEISYVYSHLGRTVEITSTAAATAPTVVLTEEYDAAGNRISVSATVDEEVDFVNTYDYDGLGRVIIIDQTSPTGGEFPLLKRIAFTYRLDGRFESITRSMGTDLPVEVLVTDYDYDDAGRLTSLTHTHDATNLASYTWVYDAAGRIRSFETVDGETVYTYDELDQLIAADFTLAEGVSSTADQDDEEYDYDLNGNRISSGYEVDSNNRLKSDGVYNYEYDEDGNRTKRTKISDGEVTEYTWDHRNRLTSVVTKDDEDIVLESVVYTYDVLNRRLSKTVDSDGAGAGVAWTEHYIYDGEQIALVYKDPDASGTANPSLTNRYLYGPQVDQILADEQFVDGIFDQILWPLADHLGTIRDLALFDDSTNSTSVANHRQYDSFGNLVNESHDTIDHLFGFTGREYDFETGLAYYRARYYDPAVGRFLSEDPLGFGAGDTNLSRYVSNSPLDSTDPSGRVPSPVYERPRTLWQWLVSPRIESYTMQGRPIIAGQVAQEPPRVSPQMFAATPDGRLIRPSSSPNYSVADGLRDGTTEYVPINLNMLTLQR